MGGRHLGQYQYIYARPCFSVVFVYKNMTCGSMASESSRVSKKCSSALHAEISLFMLYLVCVCGEFPYLY